MVLYSSPSGVRTRDLPRGLDAPRRNPYPTDLSDNEWTIVEPLVPTVKSGGRPARRERREIANAIALTLTSILWDLHRSMVHGSLLRSLAPSVAPGRPPARGLAPEAC
jgi:hypothetical protein